MKRLAKKTALLFIFFFLACTLAQQFPVTARAASFDGFEYSIVGGTSITITGYTGSDTDLTVPSSIESLPVTKIGAHAFENKGITSIVIPDPVADIDDWAFYNCRSLSTVSLPPTSLRRIGWDTFLQCFYMTVCDLPDGLERIEASAFFYCYGLEKVTIPASVTYIGSSAYGMCALLETVFFEGNAPTCSSWAFRDTPLYDGTYWYSSIFYNEGATGFSTPTWNGYHTVMVPNGLEYAVADTYYITVTGYTGTSATVDIPYTLNQKQTTMIGANAFASNPYIHSVTIPGPQRYASGVIRIASGAFYNCSNLSSVSLPASLTTIETNAFASSGLESITIPTGVTSIGDTAFANCASLSAIWLSGNAPSASPTAFSGTTADLIYTAGATGIDVGPWNTLHLRPICTVSFDSEGGSDVSVQTKLNDSTYGKASDGTTTEALPEPTRTGYSFAGWWTEEDGKGAEVTNNTVMTAMDNHTLYASWTPDTVTITYDAQRGSVTPASQDKAYESVYGKASDGKTELLPTPSRPGFAFGGWWTEEDGEGVEVTDETQVTSLAGHILYAKWTPLPITNLPQVYTMYTDGRVTWDPQPSGGTWDWDHTFFSATFNSPATFTALKTGTSTITYTVNGLSQSISVTVEPSVLPATGQDFTLILILAGCAALAAAAAFIIRKRTAEAG